MAAVLGEKGWQTLWQFTVFVKKLLHSACLSLWRVWIFQRPKMHTYLIIDGQGARNKVNICRLTEIERQAWACHLVQVRGVNLR